MEQSQSQSHKLTSHGCTVHQPPLYPDVTVPATSHAHCTKGDALYEQEDYKAAEASYLQALQQRSSTTNLNVNTCSAELKFSIFKCRTKAADARGALTILSTVPTKSRTAAMNAALGKAYRRMGSTQEAAKAYQAVVAECPGAIDAAQALATLTSAPVNVGEEVAAALPWVGTWLEGQVCASKLDHKGAVARLVEVEANHLPSNAELLVQVAECQWRQGKLAPAIAAFEKARAADPQLLTKMDVYADALVEQGKEAPLNALASALLQVSKARPEPWVAVARLCLLRGQNTLARRGTPTTFASGVQYAEKALALAPHHTEAELALGSLLVLDGEAERAEGPFRRVYRRGKTFEAYKGLISCFLKLNDLEGALRHASEAYKTLPKNPRVMVMFGLVCRRFDGGNEKAKVLFKNALVLDPTNAEAILATADLDCHLGKVAQAVSFLKKNLQHLRPEVGNTRLGSMYMMLNNHADAVSFYDLALKENSEYYLAIAGSKRAHRLLDGGEDDEGEGDAQYADQGESPQVTPDHGM